MEEIVVVLSPARIQQGKMRCVFYENKFILKFKREALIDFSAGKTYEIPLNTISKISDTGPFGKGIEIILKNKNIDFPRGATASFVGGMVGAIMSSKNFDKFILYFNYKKDKIAFLYNCKLRQNGIVYYGNVTNQELENYGQKTPEFSRNFEDNENKNHKEIKYNIKIFIIIFISLLLILVINLIKIS